MIRLVLTLTARLLLLLAVKVGLKRALGLESPKAKAPPDPPNPVCRARSVDCFPGLQNQDIRGCPNGLCLIHCACYCRGGHVA